MKIRHTRGSQLQPLFRSQLSAWYRYRSGVTNSGGVCSTWADSSNQVASLTASGSARPTVLSDGSLLFDGAACNMTAAFTLAQPCAFFMTFTWVSWANNAVLLDGSTATASLTAGGSASAPTIAANAGSGLTADGTIPIGVHAVTNFYMNNTTSQYGACAGNAAVNTTGTAGSNNPGGISVGANRSGSAFANIAVREILVYNGVLTAYQILMIQRYMGQVGNVGGI
jgi:hypothetical protein